MRKTALNIVESVFKRMNIPYLTSLVSQTDPAYLEQIEWLYQTCEELRRKGPFRQQITTHDFATVASTNTYPLPGDFQEAIPLSFYNENTNWKLIGPFPDSLFLEFKEGVASIPSEYIWRIKGFDENTNSASGRQIEVFPTPSAAETLSFDYITGHLFIPPGWAPSTLYTSGDYVNLNGRIYLCDTNGTSGSTGPTGTDDNQSDGTTQWDHYDSPYETIQDDSDTCIFDADIVKLGVRARFLQEREKPSADAAFAEYYESWDSMRFRWEGQTRAKGDVKIRRSGTMRPYTQPGSWSWV